MTKINTDPEKIDELLTRGVEEVIDIEHLRERLLSGKQLRIKLGIDPTSPNLHLGRSVPLLKLKDFQDLGHQIVLITGDFTGVIGDTSDKDSERPMLQDEQIEHNKKSYFEQADKILDLDKVETRFNSEWLEKLTYKEIGEQADVFSVNQFIQRDVIRRRLEEGNRVVLREVLYPLMQGYDSVAIKADVELGGLDQRFNLLAGRDLQRHYNQEPQDIIMNPLINGLDGRKMSSSWGNVINILDEAGDMFGKVMSANDDVLITYFTMLTRVPMQQVREYEQQLTQGVNPRDVKMELAHEITCMYHSQEAADQAQKDFEEAFSKGGVPEEINETQVEKGKELIEALVEAGVVPSKSEIRRLIESGAVKNTETGEKIEDPKEKVIATITLKVGKKKFIRIRVKK